MDDEQILTVGGTKEDIEKYAEQNGADLTKEDFLTECPRCGHDFLPQNKARGVLLSCPPQEEVFCSNCDFVGRRRI